MTTSVSVHAKAPKPQRKCGCEASPTSHGACSDCERKRVQRSALGGGRRGDVPDVVYDVLRSPGRALDIPTRAFFEGRFGQGPGSRPTPLSSAAPDGLSISEPGDAGEREADRMAEQVMRTPDPASRRQGPGFDFSRVRIHADERAAESARAVGALAYTVGEHVVFGAGQHEPGSSDGRRLLAHELVHVVQHDRGLAPAGALSRKATPEEQKEVAVAHHKKQQQRVIDFLAAALKLPAQKDPLHADNLYRNTAELVRDQKVTLFVLTRTHDYDKRSPGKYAYFDRTIAHPKIKGNYPLDAANTGEVFLEENLGAGGRTIAAPVLPQFVPTGRPGGAPPPTPAPTFSPASLYVYTSHLDLPEGEFRNTFVHEGQHGADLHDLALQNPSLTLAQRRLEVYKTEFRAFWIQPPPPCTTQPCIGVEAIHMLPRATDRADNTDQVSQPADCPMCPAASSPTPAAPPATQKTGMKNKRQEFLFWHLIRKYPANKFDCLYVCDSTFRREVDAFDQPRGFNLVNSPRLLELNLAVQKLNPSMASADVAKTGVGAAVERLDAVDWAFLRDMKNTSRPFWDTLKAQAPAAVYNAVESWAKNKKPDQRALNEVFGVNPNPPPSPSQTPP